MTYMQAALTILAYTDRPLTIGELTAVAVTRGLVRPRGRTPDRSMSSILYRRMAVDPDAPMTATGGRFWLRGRPVPVESSTALRSGVRHVRRHGQSRRGQRATALDGRHARRPMTLPAPPALPLPFEQDHAPFDARTVGVGQRERAISRLAQRLAALAARLAPFATHAWDAERTRTRLVVPLLTLLGYRRADQQPYTPIRGRVARLLIAGDRPTLLLEVWRAGHPLADGDARASLERAVSVGLPWALLTNGRELRLYAATLPSAVGDPASALVLAIDPYDWKDSSARLDAARMLWLLSRPAVAAGALDAYLTARAVGATLLAALDDPRSPLVTALAEAVSATTGLRVPSALLARQARLAIRGARGRDGEPLPSDIPAVASVPGVLIPSGEAPTAEETRIAS